MRSQRALLKSSAWRVVSEAGPLGWGLGTRGEGAQRPVGPSPQEAEQMKPLGAEREASH